MMASCSRPPKEAERESTYSTDGPNWLELPRDVATKIIQKLSVLEIVANASQVCSLWWNMCKDPLMWRTIDMTSLPYYYPNSKLVKICHYAVERSCSHLEDINILYFATDDLLKYIAVSASNLRRVQLLNCGAISDEGLKEFVKNLPRLEELDISFNSLSKDSLEAIGRYCPLIKTLKFNRGRSTHPHPLANLLFDEDGDAFAIAKTMPELRHLEIVGNNLGNKGLLAILDGCPLLEYLDLGACFRVDLSGILAKRCHEQIKEIRLPIDLDLDFGI